MTRCSLAQLQILDAALNRRAAAEDLRSVRNLSVVLGAALGDGSLELKEVTQRLGAVVAAPSGVGPK